MSIKKKIRHKLERLNKLKGSDGKRFIHLSISILESLSVYGRAHERKRHSDKHAGGKKRDKHHK